MAPATATTANLGVNWWSHYQRETVVRQSIFDTVDRIDDVALRADPERCGGRDMTHEVEHASRRRMTISVHDPQACRERLLRIGGPVLSVQAAPAGRPVGRTVVGDAATQSPAVREQIAKISASFPEVIAVVAEQAVSSHGAMCSLPVRGLAESGGEGADGQCAGEADSQPGRGCVEGAACLHE